MANFTPVGVELIVKGADKFNSTLGKASGSIAGFGKAAVKAAALGAAALGAAVVGIGAASIKMAVSFESAFAGVIKTTDGLVDEMGNLTEAGKETQQGFRDLAKEIPTSVEELLAIGELGGQLGIAQEDLLSFTRTIADMGEASNLTTEEAAVGFAQLANVMGTPREEIENMASSVVELGNNLETNERDVLSFAQRIAGAGKIAGLTESDIFGISAAFSSVGIQAQAGGTATSKALIEMNQAVVEGSDKMEIFAAVAGIEAEHFGKAWEQDAGGVFGEFVKGLGLAGDDAIAILDELEIKDSQAVRAFLSLAGAGDKVTEALEMSEEAFHENIALTKEAEARYRTTESQFKIFKNVLKDIGITIGSALLPFLNKLIQAARPLIDELGKRLPEFLDKFLIPAIETLGGLFNNFLLPVLRDVWFFLRTIAVPAFGDLVGALGNVGKFFSIVVSEGDTLNDFLGKLPGWMQPVVKGLGDIAVWLGENIPRAIDWASQKWQEFKEGPLQTVKDFITGPLADAFRNVQNWLKTNIPRAIEEASSFFNTQLKPAFEGVEEFLREKLVPKIIELWENLKEDVPPAVESAKKAFEDVQPALTTFYNWINDKVNPVVLDLSKMVGETFLEKAEGFWNFFAVRMPQASSTFAETLSRDVIPFLEKYVPEALQAAKDTFQPFLDEFSRLVEGLFDEVESWYEPFLQAGRQLLQNLWDGMKSKIKEIEKWLQEKLNDIMEIFPRFSPPKDPSSPLQGLYDAGRGIIGNIIEGMKQAAPDLFATLDDILKGVADFASSLASFGGGAAAMLKKQQLKPLEDQLRAIDRRMSEINSDLESGTLSYFEQRAALQIINALTAERTQLEAEHAEVAKKITALEKAREELGFLKQQMALLDTIKKYGLDAREILGEAKLGAGATLSEIVEAMTRAVSAISNQLSSQLEQGGLPGFGPINVVGIHGTVPDAQAVQTGGVSITFTGDVNINNGMDLAAFEARILSVVEGSFTR